MCYKQIEAAPIPAASLLFPCFQALRRKHMSPASGLIDQDAPRDPPSGSPPVPRRMGSSIYPYGGGRSRSRYSGQPASEQPVPSGISPQNPTAKASATPVDRAVFHRQENQKIRTLRTAHPGGFQNNHHAPKKFQMDQHGIFSWGPYSKPFHPQKAKLHLCHLSGRFQGDFDSSPLMSSLLVPSARGLSPPSPAAASRCGQSPCRDPHFCRSSWSMVRPSL